MKRLLRIATSTSVISPQIRCITGLSRTIASFRLPELSRLVIVFLHATIGIGTHFDDALAQSAWFEDVSADVGLDYIGESWGGSWGDFNGDGWPDLWTSNHGQRPSLWLNDGTGVFTDVILQVVPPEVLDTWANALGAYDTHGAVWSDIDNDGDQDLFQAADGGNRGQGDQLLINDNGQFFSHDAAPEWQVDRVGNNSTMPLVWDWNGDGLPDIFVAGATRTAGSTAARFHERAISPAPVSYIDVSSSFGIQSNGVNSGQVTHIDDDEWPEITLGPTPEPLVVREVTDSGIHPLDAILPLSLPNLQIDVAIADFDNDLDDDIIIVRGEHNAEVVQNSPTSLEAAITVAANTERGFSFQSEGPVQFDFRPAFQVSISEIYIGATGYHPAAANFVLDSSDPANQGMAPHTIASPRGYYVGFDADTARWFVIVSYNTFKSTYVLVNSGAHIDSLAAIGWSFDDSAPPDTYLRNQSGSFELEPEALGAESPLSARNLAAADFDNDGDVDLFAVITGAVQNRPNLLLKNDGTGRFSLVAAHGAEGGQQGRGDAVAVADFNNDGFLDLFVSNGKAKPPYDQDGPYYIFRAIPNNNNWLQLNLIGSLAARDAAGTKVILTANGRSQRRIQNTGVHYRSQNHDRLHFGIGDASIVDRIEFMWPSGQRQRLMLVAVNQIVTVVEPLPADQDFDGIDDALDNCREISNSDQTDSDVDGFGNACDADFNNDCIVNFSDLALFKQAFLQSSEVFDLNYDGIANFGDLAIVKQRFLLEPGPSNVSQMCLATNSVITNTVPKITH